MPRTRGPAPTPKPQDSGRSKAPWHGGYNVMLASGDKPWIGVCKPVKLGGPCLAWLRAGKDMVTLGQFPNALAARETLHDEYQRWAKNPKRYKPRARK